MPVILIVEDDPALSNLYDQIFRDSGFQTLIARDGAMGFEMATTKNPDFILLDVQLPKMNGLDVFERLRLGSKGKDIPVIFLTNITEREEQERAMQLGAVDYMAKAKTPPEVIVDRVKKYLQEEGQK